jgi:RHS repeat-associated protein
MHQASGEAVWSADLDSYGQVWNLRGKAEDCPFRFPGQYEDVETGLYYNRFRYYHPKEGMYVSQDPIRLNGGNRLYSYVTDTSIAIDPISLLEFFHATRTVDAAERIKAIGIDVTIGRPNLDFNPSGKGGFYTTTDINQAKGWAGSSGKILVYDVPDSELSKLKVKAFASADGEWADFVTKGRKGTLIHDFDIVSGEMVSVKKLRKGVVVSIGGQQSALFTEKAAKLFDKHLVGEYCQGT